MKTQGGCLTWKSGANISWITKPFEYNTQKFYIHSSAQEMFCSWRVIAIFTRATSETYSKQNNIQFLYISALMVYYASFKVVLSLLPFLAYLECIDDPSHVTHLPACFHAIYLVSQYLFKKQKRDICQDMLRHMNKIENHEISRISVHYRQTRVEKIQIVHSNY